MTHRPPDNIRHFFFFTQTDFRGSPWWQMWSPVRAEGEYASFYEHDTPDENLGCPTCGPGVTIKSSIEILREHREVTKDLKVEVGGRAAPAIDQMLASVTDGGLPFGIHPHCRRTTDVNVGWISWKYVAYHDKQPNRYPDLLRLAYLWFSFYVDFGSGLGQTLPSVDGWIGYPIYFWISPTPTLAPPPPPGSDPTLVGGPPNDSPKTRLYAFVDGSQYWYHVGGNAVAGAVNDFTKSALDRAVPNGMDPLQSLLNSLLHGVHHQPPQPTDQQGVNDQAPFGFDHAYMLPGTGAYLTGTTGISEDISTHVSLAVLPHGISPTFRINIRRLTGTEDVFTRRTVSELVYGNSGINEKPKPT